MRQAGSDLVNTDRDHGSGAGVVARVGAADDAPSRVGRKWHVCLGVPSNANASDDDLRHAVKQLEWSDLNEMMPEAEFNQQSMTQFKVMDSTSTLRTGVCVCSAP